MYLLLREEKQTIPWATMLVLLISTLTLLHAQESGHQINRQPVVAGSFYAGEKSALESSLKELFPKLNQQN